MKLRPFLHSFTWEISWKDWSLRDPLKSSGHRRVTHWLSVAVQDTEMV